MRWIACVVVGVGVGACSGSGSTVQSRGDPVTFSGTARVFQPWCAGVAPRPEDEEAMRKGRPLTDAIHVHSGETFTGGSPIATIVPAANGTFEVTLHAGRYCVVTSKHEALDAPIGDGDAACLRELRSSCEALWFVDGRGARNADDRGGDGAGASLALHPPCDWNRPCYPAASPPP